LAGTSARVVAFESTVARGDRCHDSIQADSQLKSRLWRVRGDKFSWQSVETYESKETDYVTRYELEANFDGRTPELHHASRSSNGRFIGCTRRIVANWRDRRSRDRAGNSRSDSPTGSV
jgi:hypothetical protein